MVITMATIKGQVLIPVELRRKYHIQQGSRLAVIDREGEIIFKPLPDDPISLARGRFKNGRHSALKVLMAERKKEARL